MIGPLKSPEDKPGKTQKKNSKKNSRPIVDLLLEMAMQADDYEKALQAFDEMIARFTDFLENACRKALFRYREYEEPDLITLMNNTFLLLFQYSDSLLHIESIETEDEKEALIKSWLGKVAGREAIKMNNARKNYLKSTELTDFSAHIRKAGNNDDDEEDQYAGFLSLVNPIEEVESLTKDEMLVFSEVLNECTPREQEIILTYYDYLDGRKHLPAEEIERLCTKYDILPDNLNHIKYRTLNKIRKECLRRIEIRNPGYLRRE